MSAGGTQISLSGSWQTRVFTNAIQMSEVRKGICEVNNAQIEIRAGSQSQTIECSDIRDITVGSPPDDFADEFDEVFGIKYTPADSPRLCLIEHNSERAEIFEYKLFAKIINGSRGVVELGAMRGGQQTDVTSDQAEVAIKPDGVVISRQTAPTKEVGLGDIVNIQTGSRTVDEAKRSVIKVDYMVEKRRITSYVSLINPRIQHLLNRYMRKEYAQLRDDIATTDISETETQLVIGYYTTQDIRETMQTLTGGDKHEFEAVYEKALDHGLVTHPDDGIGLTQKGRMLANVELESVNQ